MNMPVQQDLVMDSSVIIASFNDRDPHHPKAVSFRQGLQQGRYRLHLPCFGIIEVYLNLARKAGMLLADEVQDLLSQLEGLGLVHTYDLNQDRVQKAVHLASRIIREHPKWKGGGADLVFAQVAEEKGCTLIAFDDDFKVFPFAQVL